MRSNPGRTAALLLAAALLAGCGGGGGEEPALQLGTDVCGACGMTVTDARFAALAVIDGDRVPYDAIECLVLDLRTRDPGLAGDIRVPDFDDPGKLVDHATATLVRADFPSPMGGGYAAFVSPSRAATEAADREGVIGSLAEFVTGSAGAAQ